MKRFWMIISLIFLGMILYPCESYSSDYNDNELVQEVSVVAEDNTINCDPTKEGGAATDLGYATLKFIDSSGEVYHGFDGKYMVIDSYQVPRGSHADVDGVSTAQKIENGRAQLQLSVDYSGIYKLLTLSIWDASDNFIERLDVSNDNVEIIAKKVTAPIGFTVNGHNTPYTFDNYSVGSIYGFDFKLNNTSGNFYMGGTLKIGKITSSNPNAKVELYDYSGYNLNETYGDISIYGYNNMGELRIRVDQPTIVTLSDFSMELSQVHSMQAEFVNSKDTITIVFKGEQAYIYFYNFESNETIENQMIDLGSSITLPTLADTKDYKFIGWKEAYGTTTYAPGSKITVNKKRLELYSVWEQIGAENKEITVKFDNGGFGYKPDDIILSSQGTIQLPAMNDDGEYSFVGWYDGKNTYDAGATVTIIGNKTFYAQWKKNTQQEFATVSFNTGGIGVQPPSKTATIDSNINLPNLDSVDGYVFKGWMDGNVFYLSGDIYTVKGNRVLYARWEKQNQVYSVTFLNTGNIKPPQNQNVHSGSSIQLPDLPDDENYVFMGWSDGKTIYDPYDYVPITKNTIFIAQWQSKSLTRPSNVLMFINQQYMTVDGKSFTTDAAPYIRNNRTYIPIRALSEGFGAQVFWDNQSRSVTINLDGNSIVMNMGSTYYWINGQLREMDVAPEISGIGRTYVPIRFVAEALGFNVYPSYNYDGTTYSVFFSYMC